MTKPATATTALSDGDPAVVSRPARADGPAAAVVVLLALGLSLLPTLLWWARFGQPSYLADGDELLYLSYSSQAYFNHPTYLTDPTLPSGGISYLPASQFIPAVLAARGLGLGPLGVDLIWRAWAGLSIGLGFYLLVRQFVAQPWIAAALATYLTADTGTFVALPIFHEGMTLARVAGLKPVGDLFDVYPRLSTQWRLITPGLSFGALLLHLTLMAAARRRPSWPCLAAAGLSFGLLFHVYFYFWTAAGLALALAFAVDAGHRRVAFHAGWIGGLIGLPALIAGAHLKRTTPPDWLHRSDTFLPIARFSELAIPKAATALLVISLAWLLWRRRRDLLYLWLTAAAGWLLMNHQVLTGLQIQNFHWFYVWGPCLSTVLVLLAWGEVASRPAWARLVVPTLLAGTLLCVAASAWLRWAEATRTRESLALIAHCRAYRAQRPGGKPALAPNAVVAGVSEFVHLADVLENVRPLVDYCTRLSPAVTDAEYGTRIGLNAFLAGQSRADFRAELERTLPGDWGPWRRDPARRADELARRLAAYDDAARDVAPMLDRFKVRYVARPAGQGPPSGAGWSLLQDGPTWAIWERPTSTGG